MLLSGHIENGAIALDGGSPLPEGTQLEVFVVPTHEPQVPLLTREQRIALIEKIANEQPPCDWYVDVSRESIYD